MSQRLAKILLLVGYVGFALICGYLLWRFHWYSSHPLAEQPGKPLDLVMSLLAFSLILVAGRVVFLAALLAITFHAKQLGWKRAFTWLFFHFDVGFLMLLILQHIMIRYSFFNDFSAILIMGLPMVAVFTSRWLIQRALTRLPQPARAAS
jgi:hypothetical protein